MFGFNKSPGPPDGFIGFLLDPPGFAGPARSEVAIVGGGQCGLSLGARLTRLRPGGNDLDGVEGFGSSMNTWLGQNPCYNFRVGEFATHFRTSFSGDWDVHWGYGLLTPGHMNALTHDLLVRVPGFACVQATWIDLEQVKLLGNKDKLIFYFVVFCLAQSVEYLTTVGQIIGSRSGRCVVFRRMRSRKETIVFCCSGNNIPFGSRLTLTKGNFPHVGNISC